jgi:hypothetical protein
MKMSPQEFLYWQSKRITLLAMSGAGKTTLANKLPKAKWFHYSGDYRIGTKYLREPILDNIKRQAMSVPFLRDLLLSDSIYISNKITVDNLAPVSTFLGKVGDPAQGGLSLQEFKRRQNLHRQAEIGAMNDVPEFIHKAEDIYGYHHFINDAGGSVLDAVTDVGTGPIFASRGYKTPDFFSYNPVNDSWKALTPWQPGIEGKMPSKGSAGCTDGSGIIFADVKLLIDCLDNAPVYPSSS